MKSKLLLFSLLFVVAFSNAQSKVGSIDSNLIIGLMPEAKKVSSMLGEYGKKLDTIYNKKVDAYKVMLDAFKKLDKNLSDDYKKIKYDEIVKTEQELQQNQKNGNMLMQLKRDELMRPLYKKLSNVISEVSIANGYTQILTTTGNEFAYMDAKFDITQLVMDKLGIKLPEPKKE